MAALQILDSSEYTPLDPYTLAPLAFPQSAGQPNFITVPIFGLPSL
jgi:hypothetical protein